MKKNYILNKYPELELTESGDFRVRPDLVNPYYIIDIHCHLFKGLSKLFGNLRVKEDNRMHLSLFDNSCFPITLKAFDLSKIYYSKLPSSLGSLSGVKAKYKLLAGGFVLKKATTERLLRDMRLNNIYKSVVLQINPANENSALDMNEIVNRHSSLLTFGSVHPHDNNICEKVKQYMSLSIKGWKLNPHVTGVFIDGNETINLVKILSESKLPIMSCSGLGVNEHTLQSKILSKKQKREMETQRIKRFVKLIELFPNTTFILAHGGLFEYYELADIMKRYENVYTDISTQPAQNIKYIIDKIGSERILFGSDYPFFNQAFSILSVLKATKNEIERNNIFTNNAKRILDISTV